jgi:hypothetical protein
MLSITNGEALTRALNSSINEDLKRLLRLRRKQLGGDTTDHADFAILEPSDHLADLERLVGFPVFQPTPEYRPDWVHDHGYAFELVFDLTEDFTQVVIIPRAEGIQAELLEFCEQYVADHP